MSNKLSAEQVLSKNGIHFYTDGSIIREHDVLLPAIAAAMEEYAQEREQLLKDLQTGSDRYHELESKLIAAQMEVERLKEYAAQNATQQPEPAGSVQGYTKEQMRDCWKAAYDRARADYGDTAYETEPLTEGLFFMNISPRGVTTPTATQPLEGVQQVKVDAINKKSVVRIIEQYQSACNSGHPFSQGGKLACKDILGSVNSLPIMSIAGANENQQPGIRWVKASDLLPMHKAHWITHNMQPHGNEFPVRFKGRYYMADIYDEALKNEPEGKYSIHFNNEHHFEDEFSEIEWLSESTPPDVQQVARDAFAAGDLYRSQLTDHYETGGNEPITAPDREQYLKSLKK